MKKLTQIELNQVLQQHELWLETSGDQGARGDLSHINLSGANLFCTNLSGVDLSHAQLSGANLYDTSLSGVDLSHTQLTRANLSHADLTGVQISADTRLHQCGDFRHLTCSPDALPWLILHPKWAEWKSTVIIKHSTQKAQKSKNSCASLI